MCLFYVVQYIQAPEFARMTGYVAFELRLQLHVVASSILRSVTSKTA